MKKIRCLLLAGLMVFSLAACSASGEQAVPDKNAAAPEETAPAETPAAKEAPAEPQEPAETAQQEAAAPAAIAEDTNALNLRFTPPEGYEKVNRHFEYAPDGSVVDKSFTYTFADGAEVIIGNTRNAQITDEIPQSYLDEAEMAEYMGKQFYIITTGSSIMGMCQDGDSVYGLGWSFPDTIDRDRFDHLMEGLSISDQEEQASNGDDLFDIRYTLDDSLHAAQINSNLTETADGQALDKSFSWYYGADKEHLDFRILIKGYKNASVADLTADYSYLEELEVNGIAYTARYEDVDAEQPFAYYTQHGDDVYEIRNMGVSDGWSTKRSPESYAALEALISSVRFDGA